MTRRQVATTEQVATAARVAARYGLTLGDVRDPTRNAWHVLARRECCVALMALGLGYTLTGRVVSRHPTAVRWLLRFGNGWCQPLPPSDPAPLWQRGLASRARASQSDEEQFAAQ